MSLRTKSGVPIHSGLAGGSTVRGAMVGNVDTEAMLASAWNSNLISASRRYMDNARRQGVHVTDKEARDEVAARYNEGDHGAMPQYHSIRQRLEGSQS